MSNLQKTENHSDLSFRQAAVIGGVSLLVIAALAPIGYIGIIGNIIDPGDSLSTIANIRDKGPGLNLGVMFLLINAVLDLVGAWALYIVFRQVNRSISLLSAWFRVAYTIVLVVALGHLLGALQLAGGYEGIAGADDGHLNTLMMFNVRQFYNVWGLGYTLFGFHLILLGYLTIKSVHFPLYLGILLVIAGFGYLADHILVLGIPRYDLNLSTYTFVGEVFLFIYLLIRGFRKPKEST